MSHELVVLPQAARDANEAFVWYELRDLLAWERNFWSSLNFASKPSPPTRNGPGEFAATSGK